MIMVNDVLLYFWNPSSIYSYNIVKSIFKDGFAKKFHQLYPLSISEHTLTLDNISILTEKEFLLHMFYEVLINEIEIIQFSNGEVPTPSPGYMQKIANLLKKYNGYNPKLPNLHKEILDTFHSRIGINDQNNYDKILMVEIFLSTIKAKQTVRFPLDPKKTKMIGDFNTIDKSMNGISLFYTINQQNIISSLLNNWNFFSDEEILQDIPELEAIKRNEVKSLKKHLNND